MNATLKSYDPPKYSRNGDVKFQRFYFELETGEWAATDLVPTYRNYGRWKPILEAGIGTKIGGVGLKGKSKINADSEVYIIQAPLPKKIEEPSVQKSIFDIPEKPKPVYDPDPKEWKQIAHCPKFMEGCGEKAERIVEKGKEPSRVGVCIKCGREINYFNVT